MQPFTLREIPKMTKKLKFLGDLVAYSPAGTEIVNTWEGNLSTHSVLSFSREQDGSFVHVSGDDYDDGNYPDTVSIDGHTAYCDANGTIWLEPSLTYKSASGKVIRRGLDMPPVDEPSIDFALTLGVNAERIRGDAPKTLGESDWEAACDANGWNEASQVNHLEGFIREMGLMPVFAAYAQRAAAEEGADASALS